MTEFEKMIETAVDQSKIGGDMERAQVAAMLALALAVRTLAENVADVADEIGSVGSEAHPVHTRAL
jgi:hypothetical protein